MVINLKLSLAAGANLQDLDQTIIQVQNDDWEVDLEANDTQLDASNHEGLPDGEYYAWELIFSQEETEDQYVKPRDPYEINIDLTGQDGGKEVMGPLETQATSYRNTERRPTRR